MGYNKKTGVTTVIKLTKHLCGIFDVFSPTILSWVNSSTLTTAQKAQVTDWLNGVSGVCALLRTIPDD